MGWSIDTQLAVAMGIATVAGNLVVFELVQ